MGLPKYRQGPWGRQQQGEVAGRRDREEGCSLPALPRALVS